jgi:hypothetical protein
VESVARADEFRDQAAVCIDRAKGAVHLKSKLELLSIAVAWLDLADLVERQLSGPELPAGESTRVDAGPARF